MADKVLVIRSSMIKKSESYSEALVNRFVKYYKEFHPNDEIIDLDLNTLPMASITITQDKFDNFFNQEDSGKYIDQLKSVQKVIHTTPMTNFNVTSMSKNYLDHILVANKTFSYKYDKKGEAFGLLGLEQKDIDEAAKTIPDIFKRRKFLESKRKPVKVQILGTQGAVYGWYPWGNHVAYLEGTWDFMGAKIAKSILVAGTKVPVTEKDGLREEGPLNQAMIERAIDKFDDEIKKAAEKF